MNTRFTRFKNKLHAALAMLAILVGVNVANAQDPLPAGQTYYVNGSGVDLVAPKDTFVNLSGAYTAGSAYSASTGIISALNGNGIDSNTIGQITILLVPGYTGVEPGNTGVIVNNIAYASAIRTIVLKPLAGSNFNITVTGILANNAAVFRFNGTQFFVIDGEGTSGQRNITFTVPLAGANATHRVIDMIATTVSPINSVQVKNVNLTGAATTTAVSTFAGVYIGGGPVGPNNSVRRNSDINVENCNIQGVQNGIYARGTGAASQANQDLGLTLINNTIGGTLNIGAANAAGIFLTNQANVVVRGNRIRGNLASGSNFRGIELSNIASVRSLDSNITIDGNYITNLSSTTAGTGVTGIRIALGNHQFPLNINVYNNVISNLTAPGSSVISSYSYPIGILIDDSTTNAGIDVFNNSIALRGTVLNGGGIASCLVTGALTVSGIRVVNNILSNRLNALTTSNTGYVVYGIIVNRTATTSVQSPFSDINNNLYDISTNSGWAEIGRTNLNNYTSVAEWALFTSGDNNSLQTRAFFENDTTLLTSNGAPAAYSIRGRPYLAIDILGNARPSSSSSIGAYQFFENTNDAFAPLLGGSTYLINGTENPPKNNAPGTGSFASLSSFISHLNSFGTQSSGDINIIFETGFVPETGVVPAIIPYNGMAGTRKIRLTANVPVNITLPAGVQLPGNSGLIRLYGVQWFEIDGGNAKNFTFSLPTVANAITAKLVVFAPSFNNIIQGVTLRNCRLIGNSTNTIVNTGAGVYLGAPYPATTNGFAPAVFGPNVGNFIGDNEIVAVRNGIVWSARVNTQDQQITFVRNIIGGTQPSNVNPTVPTTYIGGSVANAAGIYIKGISVGLVDSNIIRNNIANSTGFRGIDIDVPATETALAGGVSQNLDITRNTIYNLGATAGFAIGLRIATNQPNRAIVVSNNIITKIYGTGSNSLTSLASPAGIAIEPPTNTANIGIELINNTVSLTQTTSLIGGGSYSTALYLNGNVGLSSVLNVNNIYSNTQGRTSLVNPFANTYTVVVGGALNPFIATSNSNIYYAGANGNFNNNMVGAAAAVNVPTLFEFRQRFQSDGLSFFAEVPFLNDSTSAMDSVYIGHIARAAIRNSKVLADIANNGRDLAATIGALELPKRFSPLMGGATYQVNGILAPPLDGSGLTGSFNTINNLFRYINTNGVDADQAPRADIIVEITAGYTGEGDTSISALLSYPRMSQWRTIIIRPAAGVTTEISSTAASTRSQFGSTSSVLKFQGAGWVTIDGSNGTDGRNLTIRIPQAANVSLVNNTQSRVIDVVGWASPATNITIRNCNILGYSNTNSIFTYAGIYQSGVNFASSTNAVPVVPIRTFNNGNRYENNFIGGVRTGIYLAGNNTIAGGYDRNTVVRGNTIGGDTFNVAGRPTNYFGGVNNASGIYVEAQAIINIDSNVIQNNIISANGVRGIDLNMGTIPLAVGAQWCTDSAVTISRNTIRNLRSTGTTAYGIYTNMRWDGVKRFNIFNNMIAAIVATGSNPIGAGFSQNPYGILIDGTIPPANIASYNNLMDINIMNNSINLGQASILTNGYAACIGVNNQTLGLLTLQNNILQNRLSRTTAGGANYAIAFGGNFNPFSTIDNNNYFVSGAFGTNAVAGRNLAAAAINSTTLAAWASFSRQDTFSLSVITPFVSDTNLLIPNGTVSSLFNAGSRLPLVNNDIIGTPRPTLAAGVATIGAHQFLGTYLDPAGPRVFDITRPVDVCLSGLDIQISARFIDRSPVNTIIDTMYYRINNGPEVAVQASIRQGMNRAYTIPAQPDNTLIAYRFSGVDGAGLTSTFVNADPFTGYNYTSTQMQITSSRNITVGFDAPNVHNWYSEPIVDGLFRGTAWNLRGFGSLDNPVLAPLTGARAAVLSSADSTAARLVSPCLDFTSSQRPTLRLYVSQTADNPTRRDSILVRVTPGFGIWVNVAKGYPIYRNNPNFAVPGYRIYDVCLEDYAGFSGIKLGIEAYSRGGGNIIIDSIAIFDNFLDLPISPANTITCYNDSVRVTIQNADNKFDYRLFDELTGRFIGSPVVGNNGNLTVSGWLQGVDSARIRVYARNLTSNCENPFNSLSYVQFRNYKGGPFIVRGSTFNGRYNAGDVFTPDAIAVGGQGRYQLVPPQGGTNANYGSNWTISRVTMYRYQFNPNTNSKFIVDSARSFSLVTPTGSTDGYVQVNALPIDSNKTFELHTTFRLLPQGCDSTVIRYITIGNPPRAGFFVVNDTLCQNINNQLVNTSTTGAFTLPMSFNWDFGDGTSSAAASPIKNYGTPGNYRIRLSVSNNTTLIDSAWVNVTVLPSPVADFTSTLACEGKVSRFTSTGLHSPGNFYQFNIGGQVADSSVVDVIIPGVDTTINARLLVRNSLGCADTMVKPIQVFAQPLASFTAQNVCAGAGVQFNNQTTISPGKNGRVNTFGSEWSFGNGDIGYSNNPQYFYPAGGNYWVTLKVISSFGCVDTISRNVSVFNKPNVDFAIDNTCRLSNIIIDNKTTFTGDQTKIAYNWNFGDNSLIKTERIPAHSYGSSGQFRVVLTVTDTSNSCADSAVKTITVGRSAIAGFDGPSGGCINTPVLFSNTSIIPPLTTPSFTYLFGDGNTANTSNASHSYNSAGTRTVRLVVDIDGCRDTASKTINISTLQTIDFIADSIAANTVRFTASRTGLALYSWDFDDNTQIINTKNHIITHIFERRGTYNVTLTTQDANGCDAVHSENVSIDRNVGVTNLDLATRLNFNVYPNPFTQSTRVIFDLNNNQPVTIEVYDMLGRKVYNKDLGEVVAGSVVVDLDENNFSAKAAAYLIRVTTAEGVVTTQLIKK